MEVLNEVCPQAEEWQIRKELYALEVDEEVLWRPFETLSNGEQTKVLLAALFLNEGHFLLIDEPTNHLDTHGRQIVSEYLRKKKGFILVSHDRCFLDGCVDHILSLNRSNIEVQSGTFSAFLQNFEQQQRLEEAQNESLKKDIRRLSQSAKRTQGWSDRVEASKTGAADKGYIGHKSAKMMKRAKSIEARQQKAIEQKSGLLKNRERDIRMKSTSVGPHRDDICFMTNDLDIRKFGSQGQQRTAALSLKLSEIELVKEIIKDTPILLLDDVLSELDKHRQNYLLDSIRDVQTLITCTGLDDFVNHRFSINKILYVKQGEVKVLNESKI